MTDANIFELETVKVFNEGREDMLTTNIRQLLAYGMTPEAVSAAFNLPPDRIKKVEGMKDNDTIDT